MKPKVIFDKTNFNQDFLNLEFKNIYDNLKDISVIHLVIKLKANETSIDYKYLYQATKNTQVFVNIESSPEKIIVYVPEITDKYFILRILPVSNNFTTNEEVKLKCLIIK